MSEITKMMYHNVKDIDYICFINRYVGGIQKIMWHPIKPFLTSIIPFTSNSIFLWDLNGNLVDTFTGHSGSVTDISWSHDGSLMASCSSDKNVFIWSFETRQVIDRINDYNSSLYFVSWSLQENVLASVAGKILMEGDSLMESTTYIWNKRNNTSLSLSKDISHIAWNPIESTLARTIHSSEGSIIELWNSNSTVIHNFNTHLNIKGSISWNYTGMYIAVRDYNKSSFFNNQGYMIKDYLCDTSFVWDKGIEWNPKENLLAIVDKDVIRIYNEVGSLVCSCESHQNYIATIAWNCDGTLIASGSFDKTIKIWTPGGTLLRTLYGHDDAVFELAWSPDGCRLASVSRDYSLFLWGIP